MHQETGSEFANYLLQFSNPSEEELSQFLKITLSLPLQKGQRIISAGQVCSKMYFVLEGFLKYELVADGQPTVIHIASGGDLVADFFSYYSSLPAITNVVAITDCRLVVVEKSALENLYHASKTWERFGRKIAEQAIVRQIMERIKIQTQSPQDRYVELLNSRPDLLATVKLGDLSQVLGITQETLSRIRGRLKKEND